MQRTGRIGRDKFNKHPLTRSLVAASIRLARVEDLSHDILKGVLMQVEVDEAWAGDFNPLHLSGAGKRGDNAFGERTRFRPGRLRQCECDIAREIAVLFAARALDFDGRRRVGKGCAGFAQSLERRGDQTLKVLFQGWFFAEDKQILPMQSDTEKRAAKGERDEFTTRGVGVASASGIKLALNDGKSSTRRDMDPLNRSFAALRREARAAAAARFSRKELAQLALFKDAHQETIVPVLQNCPVRPLGVGDVLLRAGESCEALYLILSGRLRLQDPSSTLPDSVAKAGESIGETFLLQDAVVAWTVSAAEPTRVLVVDQQAAWELIRSSHEIARNWLALLADRARIGGAIRASEELKTSYRRHATLDDCTGLHNRLWLDSIVPRQIARSAKDGAPLGILLVEIDDYASYGAQFGLAAGEHARYAVAQTLANNLRPTDLVACYGAASFAAILPGSDVVGACSVAERIRHAVSEAVVLMSDQSILPSVTVSVGAAQFEAGTDAKALYAAAEIALASAKTIGGNRVGMQLTA